MAGDEVGWVSRGQEVSRDMSVITHTQINKVFSPALNPSVLGLDPCLAWRLLIYFLPGRWGQPKVPPNGSRG